MSDYLQDQLDATGIAQVLIVLKSPANVAAATAEVTRHFQINDSAPQAAMAFAAAAGRSRESGRRSSAKMPPACRVFEHLGIVLGTVNRAGLNALKADSKNVEHVGAAPVLSLIRPTAKKPPAKPKTSVTWGISALEADKAWAQGYTGKNVLVGHLDTGIDGKHPTLKKAIAEFAEFDFSGAIVKPTPPAHDSDEHGTHTAATIAGRPVKVSGKTVHVGVAPDAKLISALVIEGGDAVARVLAGMNWIVGKKARVLSMSLGFRGYTEAFRPVTQILRQRGVLPVFAAGNEGPGTSRSPGNYPEALSVGAVGQNGLVANFSSSQRFLRPDDPLVPDIIGPGVDVISAKTGGGFQSMDGTSMATPHIAGLAALLFQKKPSATVDEVEAAIYGSCVRLPSQPEERANRGMPNALRALAALA